MTYGLKNKETGQVEQIVEGSKAEAQKLCRILNKDQRTRGGDDPIEPPMHEGERVLYEVVPLDIEPPPPEEE
jgi:acylphosphatase